MITIYVVRHGETEYNAQRRIQGQIDTPLTDEGYRNAFVMAGKLKGLKFDHIYSSDLGRAFITAHVIAEKLELVNRIVREKRLREKNYGEFNGKLLDEVIDTPGFRGNPDFVPRGGESFKELQKRVAGFLKELEERHKDMAALVVTHAGCIQAILGYFQKIEPSKCMSLKVSNEYIGKFIIEKGKLAYYERVNGI
ncbi:MAG: histidine phosphatase family protein [archaeon]